MVKLSSRICHNLLIDMWLGTLSDTVATNSTLALQIKSVTIAWILLSFTKYTDSGLTVRLPTDSLITQF